MTRDIAISISAIVVAYNEENKIGRCIDSLIGQQFSGLFEIIIIDNGSTDATNSIIASYAQNSPVPLRSIARQKRGIAACRQFGIDLARYGYIAFTDADCVAPHDWLERLAAGFSRHRNERLAAVGGGNFPPAAGPFYCALLVFLNSYLGSHGSVQGMRYATDRSVDHLSCSNVLYSKSALRDVGGFDAALLNIGEDIDASYRLTAKNYHLYYIADACVVHYMRDNLAAWSKNMFTYGFGRIRAIQKHPRMLSFKFLIPAGLVTTLFVTLPIAFFHPIFLTVFVLYVCAIVAYSLLISITHRSIFLCHRLIALYITTHICYGIGELYAIFNPPRR